MMLQLDRINQFYGDSHTLWDLSLEIPQGSRTCLLGRNGVGKTTTLKCIMGLIPIADGTLRFEPRRAPSAGSVLVIWTKENAAAVRFTFLSLSQLSSFPLKDTSDAMRRRSSRLRKRWNSVKICRS